MPTDIPDDQSNRMELLPTIVPEDLLPPLKLWQRLGGIAGVITIGTILALVQIVTYRETIKAPVVIRPEGDLRLVEATASGRIHQIMVRKNDRVKGGEVIAYLDDTQLQNRVLQLQMGATQIQQQIDQIDNQLRSLNRRMVETNNQTQSTVRASEAELALAQQQFQQNQQVNQSDLQQLQAEVELAQENVNRYQQLVGQGAIAISQLREREVALEVALASLAKAKVTAQPSQAAVIIAQQQITQTQAQGNATLAQLTQESDTLQQQRSVLLNQLQQTQQDLTQTQSDIALLTLRAPVAGIIQSLELRNQTQVVTSGDAIAKIAAADDALLAKAWIGPQDINIIQTDQSAQLRISACPYTDYGTLGARVQAISPDTLASENLPDAVRQTANGGFYEVTLKLSDSVLRNQHQSCNLQAGMAGRADILTRRETIFKLVLRKLRLSTQL